MPTKEPAQEKPFVFSEDWEKQEAFEPVDFEIDDEVGIFRIREDEKGFVVVAVGGDRGTMRLNDLLPPGYKIMGGLRLKEKLREESIECRCEVFVDSGETEADTRPEIKEVLLSQKDAQEEGWRYLLITLHEIGHAVRAELNIEENAEWSRLIENQSAIWNDPELFRRIMTLLSRDERDAWVFALKNFRKIAEKLGLPQEKIFASREEIRRFIRSCLGSYKHESFKYLYIPEEQKQKLRGEMRNLFVKNFSEEDWLKMIESDEA